MSAIESRTKFTAGEKPQDGADSELHLLHSPPDIKNNQNEIYVESKPSQGVCNKGYDDVSQSNTGSNGGSVPAIVMNNNQSPNQLLVPVLLHQEPRPHRRGQSSEIQHHMPSINKQHGILSTARETTSPSLSPSSLIDRHCHYVVRRASPSLYEDTEAVLEVEDKYGEPPNEFSETHRAVDTPQPQRWIAATVTSSSSTNTTGGLPLSVPRLLTLSQEALMQVSSNLSIHDTTHTIPWAKQHLGINRSNSYAASNNGSVSSCSRLSPITVPLALDHLPTKPLVTVHIVSSRGSSSSSVKKSLSNSSVAAAAAVSTAVTAAGMTMTMEAEDVEDEEEDYDRYDEDGHIVLRRNGGRESYSSSRKQHDHKYKEKENNISSAISSCSSTDSYLSVGSYNADHVVATNNLWSPSSLSSQQPSSVGKSPSSLPGGASSSRKKVGSLAPLLKLESGSELLIPRHSFHGGETETTEGAAAAPLSDSELDSGLQPGGRGSAYIFRTNSLPLAAPPSLPLPLSLPTNQSSVMRSIGVCPILPTLPETSASIPPEVSLGLSSSSFSDPSKNSTRSRTPVKTDRAILGAIPAPSDQHTNHRSISPSVDSYRSPSSDSAASLTTCTYIHTSSGSSSSQHDVDRPSPSSSSSSSSFSRKTVAASAVLLPPVHLHSSTPSILATNSGGTIGTIGGTADSSSSGQQQQQPRGGVGGTSQKFGQGQSSCSLTALSSLASLSSPPPLTALNFFTGGGGGGERGGGGGSSGRFSLSTHGSSLASSAASSTHSTPRLLSGKTEWSSVDSNSSTMMRSSSRKLPPPSLHEEDDETAEEPS